MFVKTRGLPPGLAPLDQIVKSGRNAALMAHFSHPREMATPELRHAVGKIRNTGTVIRTQSPLINHVNNCPKIWRELWSTQVAMGMVPYYMFVERDTGAREYFEIPLYEALKIYREAYSNVSGLARTVRGPVMSMRDGKLLIVDLLEIENGKYFLLQYIQARNPEDV